MDHNKISAELRQNGICPTQQRIAVYEYLIQHRTHPTADTVYQALVKEQPSLSRTTVYNTVNALAKAGLIRVVTIDADEQHFDAGVEDHGHFRCSHCGTLYDFPLTADTVHPLLPDGFRLACGTYISPASALIVKTKNKKQKFGGKSYEKVCLLSLRLCSQW